MHEPEHRGLWERVLNFLRDADVGEQHEFLHQAVCLTELLLFHVYRVRRFSAVEMDFDFRRGKVKCARSHPPVSQLLGEVIEQPDALRKFVRKGPTGMMSQ